MGKVLSVFDASGLVYTGNAVLNKANEVASKRFNNIPIGGLKYAIKFIMGYKFLESRLVVCFDSKTDKKESYGNYKGNREFNNAVFTQLEILRYLLPKMGIEVIKADNYEADDLIYSMVYKHINNYDKIYVFADDSDLAGTMISNKVVKVGTSSRVPLITKDNYSATVRKGKQILYNTILPYYLFNGKESNNLSSLKNGKLLYADFIDWVFKNKIPQEQCSYKSIMGRFLTECYTSKKISSIEIQDILKRCEVVYPRIHENPDSLIEVGLNKKVCEEYLSVLGLREICSQLGVIYRNPDTIESSKFLRWLEIYNTGIVHVDNDKPSDKTFWFNDNNLSSQDVGGF